MADNDKYENFECTKLNEYTLLECLNTKSLNDVLKKLDYKKPSNSVLKMCELFGVTDSDKYSEYDRMAKANNGTGYFRKLLDEYALHATNIEDKVNSDVLKSLEDLQRKLWYVIGDKLTCKNIKKKETEILKQCLLGRDKNNNNLVLHANISLYTPNSLKMYDSHQQLITMRAEEQNFTIPVSLSSVSAFSFVSGQSDFNNNQLEKSESMPIKKIINVSLYYNPKQEAYRIENFRRAVNSLNPNIVFKDISAKSINELTAYLADDVPIFILFDKEIAALIDPDNKAPCQCETSTCSCALIQPFFMALYRKFLNEINLEKVFPFIMDEWIHFKTPSSPFRNSWLLRFKFRELRKILIRPYIVPCAERNVEFSPNCKYFLANFMYPNYSFLEGQ